jgi:Phage major capsid protein E
VNLFNTSRIHERFSNPFTNPLVVSILVASFGDDLATLISNLAQSGEIRTIAAEASSQFGGETRRYVGAEILPEMPKEENSYTEEEIVYRTVVAVAGSRYSPPVLTKSGYVGNMTVTLGESSVALEFTAQEYDALTRMLRRVSVRGGDADMEAIAALIKLADRVNTGLIEFNEQSRWQALVNGTATLAGANGYTETVVYPNPPGHRSAAGGAWTSNAYDPYLDIEAKVALLDGKGYPIRRIITDRSSVMKLLNNQKVQARLGRLVLNEVGQVVSSTGRPALAELNAYNESNGYPSFEMYDLQFRTQTVRFFPANAMQFIGESERTVDVDAGDEIINLQGVLGYVGIGRPAGREDIARHLRMEYKDQHPPRVVCEGVQTSLPVIQEPEATATITGIA